jgi:GGDEF domain-containing protein
MRAPSWLVRRTLPPSEAIPAIPGAPAAERAADAAAPTATPARPSGAVSAAADAAAAARSALTPAWPGRAVPPRAPAPGRPAGESSLAPTVGQMLDLIGSALAATGHYATDAGGAPVRDVRMLAERWRRHVTTGLGHPGDPSYGAGPRSLGLAERDWAGAARFITDRRRLEYEHAQQATREFRETIWALVQGLRTVVEAEAASSQRALEVVERARAVIADADAGTVRGAALAAAGELGSLLEERGRARRAEVADLGARVARFDGALGDARGAEEVDPLTGAAGRRALEAAMTHAAGLRALWGQRVCLVLVAAPSADDAVLLATAGALARVFLGRGDALFRYDACGFAVLLGNTGAADAIPLLERVPAHVVAPGAGEGAGDDAAADGPSYPLAVGFAELGGAEGVAEWLARAARSLEAERRGAADPRPA